MKQLQLYPPDFTWENFSPLCKLLKYVYTTENPLAKIFVKIMIIRLDHLIF